MELEIDQARLASALALARTVADRRASMPILANVLLHATTDGQLTCSATDTMTAVTDRLAARVLVPGSIALGAKPFHETIRTLPEGPLRLRTLDNHWAQITSGTTEFRLMGQPESDFPELPDPRATKFAKVSGETLATLVHRTQFSVSTDDTRVNLSGVLLECDGQRGTMVSTDGHRLTKYTSAMSGPIIDPGIIIPRKGLSEIRRVLERPVAEIGLAVSDQHLFLQQDGLLLSIKLHAAAFPPYRQVIPAAHDKVVQLPRKVLGDALKRVEVMAPEKTATVRLALESGSLELLADNPELGLARQSLEVEYRGPSFVAGFNARYLLEALEVIADDNIRLEFQGELDPCVLRPDNETEDFLAVVMPMRI